MGNIVDEILSHLFQIVHPGHIISDQYPTFSAKTGHFDLHIVVFKQRRTHFQAVGRFINMVIVFDKARLA